MQPFHELDLYGYDALLTEDERIIRDSVRRFVEERVLPVIEEHNRAGTFPRHLVPEMAELGLLAPTCTATGAPDSGPRPTV